jgi:hypothetical protein
MLKQIPVKTLTNPHSGTDSREFLFLNAENRLFEFVPTYGTDNKKYDVSLIMHLHKTTLKDIHTNILLPTLHLATSPIAPAIDPIDVPKFGI